MSELRVSMACSSCVQCTVARATASAVDRGEIPFDAEAGRRRRQRVAVAHRHARRRDRVELRDVLDPRAVRHRGRQRHVQLHQEMRADGDVESLGEMRDLEPRRDAADARAVDLDDRARAALEILAEMRRVVERFADRDRHRRLARRARRGRRGPRPAAAPRTTPSISGAYACARRQRLGDGERLVGVDHHLERVADRLAHRRQPRDVLGDRRLADLDLARRESPAPSPPPPRRPAAAREWCSQPPSVV